MDPAGAAEKSIQRWDSSSSSADDTRRSSASEAADMAVLEDEFRSILLSQASPPEADSLLASLASLSLSSSFDYPDFPDDDAAAASDPDEPAADPETPADPGTPALARAGTAGSASLSSRRSASSIRELDLIPAEAAQELRRIAERMTAAGYGRECVQAYSSVRKAAVDRSLRQLGVEKLSIGDVQRLPWEALEAKIRRWIRAAKACVRVVFASERRLCDLIFSPGSPSSSPSSVAAASPFGEAVKGAALQLFGFAEAIAIGRRSPEKLFKILDLHDALSDLLPDVSAVFGPSSPVPAHVSDTLSRLAEAARGILSEFESAVLTELSKTPVPGGTVHPLTRYVMNYLGLISEYAATLSALSLPRPSPRPDDPLPLPDLHPDDLDSRPPLAAHLVWTIAILDSNLNSKSHLYKDPALGFLFIMNNVHYIVHKAKALPELRELVGDDYLRRLTRRYQQAATGYQRAAWVKVLHCLRDEGIHVSGSFSSGVSKSVLRERFKSFNAAFDETHRTQAAWSVPDLQLREELRISVSERLLPAYRSFLGRFKHHIEGGRHPEMYIKYSVEDLEIALSDFFEGISPSQQARRRNH